MDGGEFNGDDGDWGGDDEGDATRQGGTAMVAGNLRRVYYLPV